MTGVSWPSLYSKESGCTLYANIKDFLAALLNEYDFVRGDKFEKIYTAQVTEKALGPWDPIEITPAELRPHPDLTFTQLLQCTMDTSGVHRVRTKQQTLPAIFFIARADPSPRMG